MLKITNVNVYGLEESIIASGYSMRVDLPKDIQEEEFSLPFNYKRAVRLGNMESNSGHSNYLTGVIVQFDVTYPEYWSPEFQRYHFAQIISSQSKMHKITSFDFEDSCNEFVSVTTKNYIKELQNKYMNDPTYENFMILLSNCPMGFMKTMRVSSNYLQLLTIWNQRRHHKLKNDWGVFCDWIETLPHFVELTGIKIKEKENV